MFGWIDLLFSMPVLPGTIGLGVCLAYWLCLIAGMVDLDLFDFGAAADFDADASSGGWGLVTLKFLNVQDVPFMIWLTVFSLAYVGIGLVMGRGISGETDALSLAARITGYGVLAAVLTKVITQPLRGRFETPEPNTAQTLIGRTCVITTKRVDEEFGQGLVETVGAPLLLSVRSRPELFAKGDLALIVDYDSHHKVFRVEPADSGDAPRGKAE